LTVISVVITALPTKITVFWNTAEEPEDEDYIFLQNIRIYLPECTVSHPRRLWTFFPFKCINNAVSC